MALNLPTFFKRLGSAIVFSAVMMGGLLWNHWAFGVLLLVIMLLCMREFFKLIAKIFGEAVQGSWTSYVMLFVAIASFAVTFLYLFYPDSNISVKALLALSLLLLTVGLVKSLLQKTPSFNAFALKAGSLIYILVPVLMLLYLRHLSLCIPLALILMIWMNDTMAYMTGSFIGKTPFSKISPKKTWEGTIGGLVFTIAGAAVWGYFSPYYHMIDWMVLALCAAVAGTAGDLFESKLKRMAEVKDSGTLMPGHGGALDRFDSLLVVTPFAFTYAFLFMPPVPLTVF